jgi:hypothetical protein
MDHIHQYKSHTTIDFDLQSLLFHNMRNILQSINKQVAQAPSTIMERGRPSFIVYWVTTSMKMRMCEGEWHMCEEEMRKERRGDEVGWMWSEVKQIGDEVGVSGSEVEWKWRSRSGRVSYLLGIDANSSKCAN